ncbi:nucleotide-binding protein [Candidatus Woesearchaeota archaeon]|nr:nucleotide-binding protein [Candidatus Woesearchaeota archaeon]
MPVQIILDTNFLLIPGQFRVDIFSEILRICSFRYELCVLDSSVGELKGIIGSGKGADKASARLALQLINAKKLHILSPKTATFKNVDETILDLAAKNEAIAATQDKELRSKMRKLSAKVIVLKQKKYLELLE